MIFVKSHKVYTDTDAVTFKADVVVKVDHPDQLPNEIKAILSTVIQDERTDLYMSEQIAKIMSEEADKLATRVKLLMEGE